MAANCAGIAGAQIFRTEYAPKYLHGLTAIIGLAAAGWVLIVVQIVQYYLRPRNLEESRAKSEKSTDTDTEERDVEK